MPKPPYRTAPATSANDVEAAFYEALQTANLERLMACWAEDEEVVCVLPGGPRLLGAAAIRAAFEHMFSFSPIRATPQHVHAIESISTSVHNVIEQVEFRLAEGPRQSWVAATNVYFKTVQGWRMVAHHASPGARQPADVKEPQRRLLH